ncbi:MAG: hypothetical protein ACEY3K_01360 [Wolbachia sp.]
MRNKVDTHRPKGAKKWMIRLLYSDQDVSDLPANSKDLSLIEKRFHGTE